MKNAILFLAFLFFGVASAQNPTKNPGGFAAIGSSETMAASAIIEARSTTKGFLMPRMTQAQRMAIVLPTEGLQVYQTNGIKGIYYYNGSQWFIFAAGNDLNNYVPLGGTQDGLPVYGQIVFDGGDGNTGYQSANSLQYYNQDGTENTSLSFNHFESFSTSLGRAGLYANSLTWNAPTGSNYGGFDWDAPSGSARIHVPDIASNIRYLALKVNGVYADSSGNIAVSSGTVTQMQPGGGITWSNSTTTPAPVLGVITPVGITTGAGIFNSILTNDDASSAFTFGRFSSSDPRAFLRASANSTGLIFLSPNGGTTFGFTNTQRIIYNTSGVALATFDNTGVTVGGQISGTNYYVSGATNPIINYGNSAGITRTGPAVLAFGNGTAGDYSGTIAGLKLGLGVLAPKETIDVYGNIVLGNQAINATRYLGIGSNTSGSFGANSGFSGLEFGSPQGTNSGYIAFHTHNYGSASGERMRIDKLGNLLIGTTTSSGAKVDIAGPVTATGAVTGNTIVKLGGIPGQILMADGSTTNTSAYQPAGSYEASLTFNPPLSRTGNTVSIPQSSSTVNGYLSSIDWNTFNNKQPAGTYLTSNQSITVTASGDATGTGSGTTSITIPLTLATTTTAGTTGSASSTSVVQRDAKGRIISATDTPIQIAESQVTNLTSDLASAGKLNITAVKTGSYSPASGEFVPYNLTGGNGTVTLPTTPADGTTIGVKITSLSGTNTVTVNAGGSDVFNVSGGVTTFSLSVLYQQVIMQYKASQAIWYIIDSSISKTYVDTKVSSVTGTAGNIISTGGTNPVLDIGTNVVTTTGTQTVSGKNFATGNTFPTFNQNTTGSAATLTTPRSIATTGDGAWSVNFDGSANVSAALTLATVNSNTGTFGSATQVPAIAVNAKGLITGVTATTIQIPEANVTNLVSDLAAKENALTFSTGFTRSVNTVTNNLSTGVSGGQSAIGGTASGDNLTLTSTTNGTKGKIIFGTASAYDQANDRLGILTTAPSYPLDVAGGSVLVPFRVSYTGNDGGIISQNAGTLALNRTAQIRLINGSTIFGANDRSWLFASIGTSATASDFNLQYWNGSAYSIPFKVTSAGVGIFANNLTIPATPTASTDAAPKGYVDARVTSGSYTTSASAQNTFTVTIGTTQPSTAYRVFIQGTVAMTAASTYVTNKTTTTFDVVYPANLTGTVNFDWEVVK